MYFFINIIFYKIFYFCDILFRYCLTIKTVMSYNKITDSYDLSKVYKKVIYFLFDPQLQLKVAILDLFHLDIICVEKLESHLVL